MRKALGLLLLLAGIALVAVWFFLRTPASPDVPVDRVLAPFDVRPAARSVVLITTDTTRADRLEPYGATNVETPTLARLAAEGVVMERAYAVAPLTLPAHTTINTGIYPPEHGVRNNGIHYVPDEVETLAESFSARSFRTAAFVSAAVLESRYGLDQGFELYDDDLSAGVARFPRMVPDRPAAATVDSASAWLDQIGPNERFFVWVHFYDPHAAYNPPPPFRDQYRDRLYDGEIAYMDSQIERLLEHPRLQAEERLVVTVLADHGESLGEHGESTHGVLAYGATLHVPWILWLRDVELGVRVGAPVSQVDVAPTLAYLAGVPAPEGTEGRSLFSSEPVGARPRVLYSESYLPFYTYGWSKVRVVRQWPWEYLESSRPELYDLSRDPKELSDQAERRPEIVHDMEGELGRLTERFGDEGEREQELAVDHEAMDRLRALGYVAATSAPIERAERPNPVDVIGVHTGLERARSFARDRLWEQAKAELERVLETDPGNVAALIDLSSALGALGETEEAIGVAEQALERDPQNQQVLFQLAAHERARGDSERSLELLETARSLDERNPQLWALLAGHFLGRQQPDKVDEMLTTGLGLLPDNPSLNALFAYHVEARTDPAVAEARLREAVERDPFLSIGWRFLGALQERAGRLAEAEASYREGLSRNPDEYALRANLATLLAREGKDEAEAHLREAIRLAPDFPAELHVALGAWLAEHGRLQESLAQYQLVIDERPEHVAARNNRAVALARTGKVDEAMAELEQVVEDAPGYADAHNNLAALAVFQKQWQAAERHARRTLELDDGIVEAWNNLGVALDEQGRVQPASEAFDRALAVDPTYWRAQLNRGMVLRELGRHERAQSDLEAVLATQPNQPETYYQLGELYASGPLADPAKARTLLQAFLRRAPGDPRGAEVRERLDELGSSRR